MLFDITYTDKTINELIDDCLGNQYSFFKSIKYGGIGSGRMIVEEVSDNFNVLMNLISDINYANIELRPSGIIVRITKGLKNYAWVIPYHKLVIYKADGLSIHAEGRYIRFKNDKLLKENRNFIAKILRFKADYLSNYDWVGSI